MAGVSKKIFILLLLVFSFSSVADVKWQTNLKKAQDKAAREGLDIFAYFTGSDWCSFCRKLHKDVFDKDNFLENLEKEYVLLKLDYPQRTSLPKIQKELNNRHSLDYSIEGFPTVLLMDKEGRAFAKTGYRPGGPAEYAAHLKALKQNKINRDKAFAEAANSSGLDKAKALVTALQALGAVPTKQYKNIQDEIVKNDPSDETGYQKNVLTKQTLAGLEAKVLGLVEAKQNSEAQKLVDTFLEEKSPVGETKQKAMLLKIYTYSKASTNLDEVDNLMDAIIAIDSKTETAENARDIKAQIIELKKTGKEK